MARAKGGGGGEPDELRRWPAWALAILAVGSAFAPFTRELTHGLHWALTLFAILEAGVAIGKGDRTRFLVYAAAAIVMNPLRPFSFPVQVWRLLHAGFGAWLAADHLPGRR